MILPKESKVDIAARLYEAGRRNMSTGLYVEALDVLNSIPEGRKAARQST
jgi:hypothetical protein